MDFNEDNHGVVSFKYERLPIICYCLIGVVRLHMMTRSVRFG